MMILECLNVDNSDRIIHISTLYNLLRIPESSSGQALFVIRAKSGFTSIFMIISYNKLMSSSRCTRRRQGYKYVIQSL